MSIERRESRRADEARMERQAEARQVEARQIGNRHEAASAEHVDRFRAALERQAEGKAPTQPTQRQNEQSQARTRSENSAKAAAEQARLAAEQGASGTRESAGASRSALQGLKERDTRKGGGDGGGTGSEATKSDIAGLWQAQMALRSEAAPVPTAPAPVNTQVFAELIQKHVRQMAASDDAARDSDGQVLLRMSDATLPGTDLLLSRTATGWTLRADSRSRDSYEAIRRAAPELARRFADSDLGELTIDPHFHA
ncbi:type III secretion HpaP family protein [Luteimonas aquatica]|uniref:type III secretion HpaP family protein n=1 Tax=Luteimonas aquatica TaxID=450364 RepID=UPI001F59C4B3|nr:type III secretion HpaP family protein [Luteimonas aquatica]